MLLYFTHADGKVVAKCLFTMLVITMRVHETLSCYRIYHIMGIFRLVGGGDFGGCKESTKIKPTKMCMYINGLGVRFMCILVVL